MKDGNMNARTNRAMLAIAMVAVMALSCFVVVGTSADSDASGSERGYVKIKVGGEYVVSGSEEFVSMKAALNHINNTLDRDDESAGIVVECQAGKAIDFVGAHQCVVKRSITIEGNGAYGYFDNPGYESSKGGEVDFCIEQHWTNGNPDIMFDHDVHLTINDLHNFGVWGTRLTEYTFNLELNDCTSSPADYQNQMRIYINGTTGYNNITLNGCKFYENSSNCTVYSNANGTINVNDCIFDGVSEPININSKSANVDVKINVNRCSFNNSGIAKIDGHETWAAPIRVVNSTDANGSSIVSVDSCEFTYDEGKAPDNGDVLIGDGRSGQGSKDVKLTVRNTTADVQFQEPGYYTDDPSNPTDGSKIQSSVVRADQILESTGSDVTISDAPVDVPDTPDYDDEDDDDYPFIPGNNTPQTSTNSNDDRTTLVASAAAVVVIMLAVVALMATRNN